MYVCIYSQHFQQGMGHPGMIVNPARGQLNRRILLFPFPRSRLRIWPRKTGAQYCTGTSSPYSFVCISLAADGPLLSRPPIATLPPCLRSLGIFPFLPGSRLQLFLSRCKFSTLLTPRQLTKWLIVELHFIICVFALSATYGRSQSKRTGPVKNRTHDFVLITVKLRGCPIHSTRATEQYFGEIKNELFF